MAIAVGRDPPPAARVDGARLDLAAGAGRLTAPSADQNISGICNDLCMQSSPATSSGAPAGAQSGSDRDLIDGFIAASRALVAVAARSLADLDEEITLPQYRALVVLAVRGPQRAVDLADALGVTAGTGSRMIERLARKQLVRRSRSREDRRTVRVHLTRMGREVVARVTERRRAEIASILEAMPTAGREAVVAALHAFAGAAGEAPEPDWALGWDE